MFSTSKKYCSKQQRTNEVYLPKNGVNNDRLPSKLVTKQQWKETDKITKEKDRERKRKNKTKYIVIHKIAAEKYKKTIDTIITSPHIEPHRVSEIQS